MKTQYGKYDKKKIQMIFPILYKNVKGKILEWKIKVHLEFGVPEIYTMYGYIDGTFQVNRELIEKGKNKGKANETTPWEQACLEAESRFVKQLERKGYGLDPEGKESRSKRKVSPMLAYDITKVKLNVDKVYIQPKIDGHRCLIYHDGKEWRAKSRQNKQITTIPHILKEFKDANQGLIYDGELYIHKEKFENVTSAIKKKGKQSKELQFHCYDAFAEDISSEYRYRRRWVEEHIMSTEHSVLVETAYVHVSKIEKIYRKFVKQGYEGAMVRIPDSYYEPGKRSKGLLKVKKFLEQEYPIVGIEQGRGKYAGMATFVCATNDGTEFNVLSHGNHKQKKKHWKDRRNIVCKKSLTVKYFELTKNGVPRFPIAIRFREDV